MASNAAPDFTIASDSSLLVSFGDAISLEASRSVVALTRALNAEPAPGVRNLHPAYTTLLIVFDPLEADHDDVRAVVAERVRDLSHAPPLEPRTVTVPVCYGGEFGPDLEGLAQLRGLTPDRVIELHASAEYIAYFIGFVPGFAYLGGLPPELAAPRLSAPRAKVPAGSVGIAGNQTGVYPFETPGGWRLIGRTPAAMFQPGRDPMSLIAMGDRVRFMPVSAAEFREAAR
jgi:inhibitor of KinA